MIRHPGIAAVEGALKAAARWLWTGFVDALPRRRDSGPEPGPPRLEVDGDAAGYWTVRKVAAFGHEQGRWRLGPGDRIPGGLRRAARRRPVFLRVPDTVVLTRMVRLPEETINGLDHVVALNLETWTAFPRDRAAVRAAVVGSERGNAVVQLSLVPVIAVEDQLRGLVDRKVPVDGVCAEAPVGLLPFATSRLRRFESAARMDGALAVLAAILLAITLFRAERQAAEEHASALREITQLLSAAKSAEVQGKELARRKAAFDAIVGGLSARTGVALTIGGIVPLLPAEALVTRFAWGADGAVVEFEMPAEEAEPVAPPQALARRLPPLNGDGARWQWIFERKVAVP